jgi:hypothetical protein
MRVSSATRSVAAIIGGAGIVVPGLAFATATPAAANEVAVGSQCNPGSDGELIDGRSITDNTGREIGKVGLYRDPRGCWSGVVTSTFHTPATALLRTGASLQSTLSTRSCLVPSGGSKCLAGGLFGQGFTDVVGNVSYGNSSVGVMNTHSF